MRPSTRAGVILGAVFTAAAFAVGGWAAVAPLPGGTREVVYTVPRGGTARAVAGNGSIFPSRLRFTVGVRDVLVLRNEDDVPASFGPVRLEPGQTYRVPFHAPAEFELACSLHPAGQVSIVVVPTPPPGLARLGWRLAEVMNR